MANALVLKTKIDNKDFTKEISFLERKLHDLEATIEEGAGKKGSYKITAQDMDELRVQAEKTKNRLVGLYQQQNKINEQGFSRGQDALQSMGNSAKNVGKSIVRWGLALIGVRSAMTLIRSSMSTISQYDDQLAKDVEYLRYVLAMMLKPVIETIVNLIYKALQYINYIAQALFGVNLFANASASSFEKTNKSSKSIAKNLKDANKELLGFDKINKLNAQDTSSGAGGDTGAVPRLDLSEMLPEGEIPEWLKWILEHKDELISGLLGIAGGLIAIKLGYDGITALGVAVAIYGICELVKNLSKYIQDLNGDLDNNGTSWKQFGEIIADIGLIIIGVGIIIGSIPVILSGVVVAVLGLILSAYDSIIYTINTIRSWIDRAATWLERKFGILFDGIIAILDFFVDIFEDTFIGLYLPIKNIFDGILFFLKGDWENGIKSVLKGIYNFCASVFNKLIDALNLLITPLRVMLHLLGRALGMNLNITDIKIPRFPYLKVGGIINYPGRGVPVGASAIGGEAGAEGVIPLTNSQSMETLGEAIGKYIKVNIDLTTELDGRVLSRRMHQIDNENTFARNGG